MCRSSVKPIYVFADSRLLFWRRTDGELFLNHVWRNPHTERPVAAYIGASNHNNPAFYHEIFEPAMQQISADECRMILTTAEREDKAFLERADIILLAGGDVGVGWRAFREHGFQELIQQRFHTGAVLIGVSAGAVQLGLGGLSEDGSALLSTFGLLPFYVGAHDEHGDWASLRKALGFARGGARGIGIPSGGGIIYHSGVLEPVSKPALEILVANAQNHERFLFPNAGLTLPECRTDEDLS